MPVLYSNKLNPGKKKRDKIIGKIPSEHIHIWNINEAQERLSSTMEISLENAVEMNDTWEGTNQVTPSLKEAVPLQVYKGSVSRNTASRNTISHSTHDAGHTRNPKRGPYCDALTSHKNLELLNKTAPKVRVLNTNIYMNCDARELESKGTPLPALANDDYLALEESGPRKKARERIDDTCCSETIYPTTSMFIQNPDAMQSRNIIEKTLSNPQTVGKHYHSACSFRDSNPTQKRCSVMNICNIISTDVEEIKDNLEMCICQDSVDNSNKDIFISKVDIRNTNNYGLEGDFKYECIEDVQSSTSNKPNGIYNSIYKNAGMIHSTDLKPTKIKRDPFGLHDAHEYVLINTVSYRSLDIGEYDCNIGVETNVYRELIKEALPHLQIGSTMLMLPTRISHFMKNLESNRVPLYMLYSLVLVGSRYIPRYSATKYLDDDKLSAIADRVEKYLSKRFDKPRLNHIWCRLLLGTYYELIGKGSRLEKNVEMALSAAILMKLNNIDSSERFKNLKPFDNGYLETEFKRRIWWTVFLKRSFVYKSLSERFYGDMKDIFLKLPANDYFWTNSSMATHSSSTLKASEPSLKLCKASELNRGSNGCLITLRCKLAKIQNSVCNFVNKRQSLLKKDMDKDYFLFNMLIDQLQQFTTEVENFINGSLKKAMHYRNLSYFLTNSIEVQTLLVNVATLQIKVREVCTMLYISEIAHYKALMFKPQRVKDAKKICIENAVQTVKLCKWWWSNLPVEYFDGDLCSAVTKCGFVLLNALFVTDYPTAHKNIKKASFILKMTNEATFASPYLKVVGNILKYVFKVKRYFHKKNSMHKTIPFPLLNTAVSKKDVYPWFLPLTSTLLSHFYCAVSFSSTLNKNFLLSYYLDLKPIDLFDAGNETYLNMFSGFDEMKLDIYSFAEYASENCKSEPISSRFYSDALEEWEFLMKTFESLSKKNHLGNTYQKNLKNKLVSFVESISFNNTVFRIVA
ncbi:hypothetical protein AX774_g758 [Zancudomyces culisetae]|uniref:Transcription factor domain-containing protein n=1 Tax=Zancudomyces culisetae TaxID=1213189 RepID=A0A1R1PXJ3_ZANCU|nr:hypothetical protein AX774_g758 [Zancudomyces culisetae]|eukprot:OMH85679.1 hypothetical protein AX774_g758 [Zancudomyces culisetae]